MQYWLFKSEPDVWSIDDQKNAPKGIDYWDGIRNYQARNFIRDSMEKGDLGFFYHSNCKEPGIYGTFKIVSEAYHDFTAFDPNEKYYDPKSNEDNPRWWMIDIKFQKKFKKPILLSELKEHASLSEMLILRRGNRLSITPVTSNEWEYINSICK